MNETKVRDLISQEITELHTRIGGKAARKQYAPAKWQIEKLTELGILHLMPEKFGHSDAEAVIKAATASRTAVMNRAGEGEEIAAHPLYTAIHETELEVTSDSVRDLMNATSANAWISDPDSGVETMEQAADEMAFDGDYKEMLASIRRGLSLIPQYKLVIGKSVDVTLSPAIPSDSLAYVQVFAGWVGTAQQHRIVGITKRQS